MAGAQEALGFRIDVPFVAEEIRRVFITLHARFIGEMSIQKVSAFKISGHDISLVVRFLAVRKLLNVILAGWRKIGDGRALSGKVRTA